MKKRVLSLLLALAMCLSLSVPAWGNTYQEAGAGWVKSLSQGETKSAVTADITEKYLFRHDSQMKERNSRNSVTSADIAALCTPTKEQQIGGINCTELQLANYSNFLPECSVLRCVSLIGNAVHIDYVAKDGQELSFSYDTNGLNDFCIYDPATDCALAVSRYGETVYENFRQGQAALTYDTEAVAKSSADSPGTRASAKSNFSSQAALLNDLKSNFPIITSTDNFSKFSSSVGAYRDVAVFTGRTNYVIKTAAWDTFVETTAISVITLFLGGGLTTPVTILILTGIGVGISAAQTILDQVDLYASANYTFTGTKRASVYDTTIYNDYVIVNTLSGSGTFAGGYNSNGQFQWIINNPCTVLNNDDNSLATSAMSAYDWDISLNGYCTYTPTGFYAMPN